MIRYDKNILINKEKIKFIKSKIVDIVRNISQQLYPGLGDTVYKKCLELDLAANNIIYDINVAVNIRYQGVVVAVDHIPYRIENMGLEVIALKMPNAIAAHQEKLKCLKQHGHINSYMLINFHSDTNRVQVLDDSDDF